MIKEKSPPERGAGVALDAVLLGQHKAPAIYAAQHERAGRAKGFNTTGSTAGRRACCQPAARPSYTVSPAGQRLKRSRAAVGAAQAVLKRVSLYPKAP